MMNKSKQQFNVYNSKLKNQDLIVLDFHLHNLDMIPLHLNALKFSLHLLREWIVENHQAENRYTDIRFITLLLIKLNVKCIRIKRNLVQDKILSLMQARKILMI